MDLQYFSLAGQNSFKGNLCIFLARISTPKNIVGKTAECDRFKIDSAGAGGPRGDSLGHSFFFTQQGRLLTHPRALGIGRAARKSIHHCIK